MATPPSDDSRSLFKLLADGQWHPYENIRDELAATVPPGRALRKYQERVEYARKYKNDPEYDTSASEDDRIYFGSRACAQIAITSWKGRGLEVSGVAENKQIRIKPGFKSWGIGFEMDVNRDQDPQEGSDGPDGEGVTEVPATGSQGADDAEEGGQGHQAREPDEQQPSDWRWQQAQNLLNQGFTDEEAAEASGLTERLNTELGEEKVTTPGLEWNGATDSDPDEDDPDDLGDYSWGPSYAHQRFTRSETSQIVSVGECVQCGLNVMDEAKHNDWHQQYVARSAPEQREDMALFAESEIRTLLRDVVETTLDQFQGNMVEYLSTQFAHVDALIHLLTMRLNRLDGGRGVDPRKTVSG